ncbi:MAG: ATP-dependent helicase [Fibrobacteria bacterium]|jgi:ATP-dependent DNA helicase DinG|nr:ATP-dependent helicase [Fibrobacteria bacterium]
MSYPHALRSFVAVDTETTGLDFEHDRLIELAAVRFEDGRPAADFAALVNPGRPLSPVSRLITGLTTEELEAAPPAADTARAFLAFAGDLPLVAHNAEFDAHFVRRLLEAESLAPVPGPWIDSLLMSRIAWPAWDSHRLDALAERLRVPRDAEHRALPDARRAGFVFVAAQDLLRATLSGTAQEDLARLAADLPDWGRVFAAEIPPARTSSVPAASPEFVFPDLADVPAVEPVPEAVLEAATEALSSEGWLALETPPGLDDAGAAFEAAAQAAARGQRVLLALPDAYAWNALRKSARARSSSVRVAALAEPAGYLNRARLAALAADPTGLPPEERAALLPLVAWADQTPGALLADGRGFSPERSRLTALRIACETYAEDPAAAAARAAAESAGVILVTHAALGAHLRREGGLLPSCDSLVVAGAHRLPEALLRAFGRDVTLFRLRLALQLFDGANDAWLEPERQFQKFLQKAGRQASKQRPAGDSRVRFSGPFALAFGADPAPVLEALRANESLLEGLEASGVPGERTPEPRRVAERLRAFRRDFEALCEAADAEAVHAFEDVTNPHKATLRATPLERGVLGTRLREWFGAGVFLSPALLTGARGDVDWFSRALGLDVLEGDAEGARLRAFQSARTAPPPRFLMAPFAPGFSSAEPPETFARFLVESAQPFSDRGVFLFFPSQGALRTVHHALKAVLPEGTPCWAQHVDGNRDAVLRLFASARGGWVLATEGIPGLKDSEGRGPALALITRMPLPPAHDPVLEARGEILKAEGRNARAELWNPAAIVRLKKEWAGLAHDGPGPRVLWLLDARAAAEGLGAQAARSLGAEPETVKNLEDLRAATESYF